MIRNEEHKLLSLPLVDYVRLGTKITFDLIHFDRIFLPLLSSMYREIGNMRRSRQSDSHLHQHHSNTHNQCNQIELNRAALRFSNFIIYRAVQ